MTSAETPFDLTVPQALLTLVHTVQLGSISVGPWHARVQSLDTPDYTIIDLDPGEKTTFRRVVDGENTGRIMQGESLRQDRNSCTLASSWRGLNGLAT